MNLKEFDEILESCSTIKELLNKEKFSLKEEKIVVDKLFILRNSILSSQDENLIRTLQFHGFEYEKNINFCKLIFYTPFHIGTILMAIHILVLMNYAVLGLTPMVMIILQIALCVWPFILFYIPYKKIDIMKRIFHFAHACLKNLDDENDLYKKSNYLKNIRRGIK